MKQYSFSDLQFVYSKTLRQWLGSGSPTGSGKLAIVDVRDSDYVGGHIKGCWHYPAGNFHETLPQLRQRLVENEIDDVVFHCALSQVRGPKSALRFLRSLESANDSQLDLMKVWVLQGGFTSWQGHYGEDATVTEDYAKDLWQ
ncbi:CIC11C00000005614 [Sungouiella intermedia]|uniref:CIC11C00000005614 n=1 Tax=Sungouiella intermedia TaxID=45354 RepID=A0A1L0D1T9_9ASCO|nr:CIC11C00000005614 [[Candida] intermedia]